MEGHDCPRCGLPLAPDRYEKVPVDICRECWGFWLDKGEFGKIATARDFVFTSTYGKIPRSEYAAPSRSSATA